MKFKLRFRFEFVNLFHLNKFPLIEDLCNKELCNDESCLMVTGEDIDRFRVL